MSPKCPAPTDLDVTEAGGHVFVHLPWEEADRFQELFQAQDIGSTLHLDPAQREARLELWTNLGTDRVRDLLNELRSAARSVKRPSVPTTPHPN